MACLKWTSGDLQGGGALRARGIQHQGDVSLALKIETQLGVMLTGSRRLVRWAGAVEQNAEISSTGAPNANRVCQSL